MIDVHAHIAPRRYHAFMTELGSALPAFPAPAPGASRQGALVAWSDSPEDLAERFRLMTGAEVAQQVLSPTLAPYLEDESQALAAARLVNDELSEIAKASSGRLRAFASLPLPHVQASLKEMQRALDELHLAGVTMQCFCGDLSAADPRFEPLYAEMNTRGAILFVHPCVNGLCSRFITDWKLALSAGPVLEDSVIAMHYMVSQIPCRYREVKIIVPHLGGGLASLLKRLDNQLPLWAELSEAPSATARRMWYDCVCHGSSEALHAAVGAFGAERILPGSDYPFLTPHEPYADTLGFLRDAGLSARDLRLITAENAQGLFGPAGKA